MVANYAARLLSRRRPNAGTGELSPIADLTFERVTVTTKLYSLPARTTKASNCRSKRFVDQHDEFAGQRDEFAGQRDEFAGQRDELDAVEVDELRTFAQQWEGQQ